MATPKIFFDKVAVVGAEPNCHPTDFTMSMFFFSVSIVFCNRALASKNILVGSDLEGSLEYIVGGLRSAPIFSRFAAANTGSIFFWAPLNANPTWPYCAKISISLIRADLIGPIDRGMTLLNIAARRVSPPSTCSI